MSKMFQLSDGSFVDFDILYPPETRLPINHMDEYDPADDIYGEVTEEDRIKYGLQKV